MAAGGLALFLTGCLPRAVAGPSAAQGEPSGITVEGEGRVETGFDRVQVRLILTASGAPTPEEATGRLEEARQAVLNQLSSLGIPSGDISVLPPGTVEPTKGNFDAIQTLTVSATRFERMPQIASAVSLVRGRFYIGYELIFSPETQSRAREAALSDARRKAEDIASQTGNRLGRVINVVEVFSRPPTGLTAPVNPQVALSLLTLTASRPDQMVVRLRVTFSIR